MSIELTCIECGTNHHVNRQMAGRRVRCPQCDAVVHVPEPDDSSDDASGNSTGSTDDEVEIVEVELIEVESVETETPVTTDAITSPAVATDHESDHATAVISDLESDPDDDENDDDQVLVRTKRPIEEMDMTPMVDVTFLLLIFFMVTAAFSLQKSIQMPRQQTDAPSTTVEDQEEDLDLVEVQVDEFGSFLVMAPEWERETPGKQNLTTALRDAIAGAKDGMRLVVKVHELAKLGSLVDAMDAGSIAGYTELEVKQVEEFD